MILTGFRRCRRTRWTNREIFVDIAVPVDLNRRSRRNPTAGGGDRIQGVLEVDRLPILAVVVVVVVNIVVEVAVVGRVVLTIG